MSKDDIVIKAYKEIIKAQESTIDSLLAVIKSQEQVITHIKTDPIIFHQPDNGTVIKPPYVVNSYF